MTEDLVIERYKYILDQKKSLNANTFKIAVFFQAIVAGALSANMAVLSQGEFEIIQKKLLIEIIFYIFIVASITCTLLLIGGIFAWKSYRREEIKIESQIMQITTRSDGKLDWIYWYETYILILFLASIAIYSIEFPKISAISSITTVTSTKNCYVR